MSSSLPDSRCRIYRCTPLLALPLMVLILTSNCSRATGFTIVPGDLAGKWIGTTSLGTVTLSFSVDTSPWTYAVDAVALYQEYQDLQDQGDHLVQGYWGLDDRILSFDDLAGPIACADNPGQYEADMDEGKTKLVIEKVNDDCQFRSLVLGNTFWERQDSTLSG